MCANAHTATSAQVSFDTVLKLNTSPVAGSPREKTGAPLELSLADYNHYGAAINYSPHGGTSFEFTLGPVPDALVAALSAVAEKRETICLRCPGAPVFFNLMTLERRGSDQVRLAGFIVSEPRLAVWTAGRRFDDVDPSAQVPPGSAN